MKMKLLSLDFWILFIFILSTTLVGCNKNTVNRNDKIIDKLYGRWVLKEWYSEVPLDINNDGNASTDLLIQAEKCYENYIVEITKGAYYTHALYINQLSACGGHNSRSPQNLPPAHYNFKDNRISLPYKYYANYYELIKLSESTLLLKGNICNFFILSDVYRSEDCYEGFLRLEREQ